MADSTIFRIWRKSSHSGGGDNCVEVAFAANRYVGVRDSKHPEAGILTFPVAEWEAFLDSVRDGEFS